MSRTRMKLVSSCGSSSDLVLIIRFGPESDSWSHPSDNNFPAHSLSLFHSHPSRQSNSPPIRGYSLCVLHPVHGQHLHRTGRQMVGKLATPVECPHVLFVVRGLHSTREICSDGLCRSLSRIAGLDPPPSNQTIPLPHAITGKWV